jgi:hypothetical protein
LTSPTFFLILALRRILNPDSELFGGFPRQLLPDLQHGAMTNGPTVAVEYDQSLWLHLLLAGFASPVSVKNREQPRSSQ